MFWPVRGSVWIFGGTSSTNSFITPPRICVFPGSRCGAPDPRLTSFTTRRTPSRGIARIVTRGAHSISSGSITLTIAGGDQADHSHPRLKANRASNNFAVTVARERARLSRRSRADSVRAVDQPDLKQCVATQAHKKTAGQDHPAVVPLLFSFHYSWKASRSIYHGHSFQGTS